MGRWAEARDGNEAEIIKALIGFGATVQKLTGGNGRPDLLIGYRGLDLLMEVKNPATRQHSGGTNKRLLKADVLPGGDFSALGRRYGERKARQLARSQAEWIERWQGSRPYIVETVDEALAALHAPDL